MAFNIRTWVDRISEFPNRRRLDSAGITDTYDVTRAEGNVPVEGDKIDAENLNDLEQRIADGFTGLAPGLVTTLACTKSATVYALTGLTAASGKVPVMWSVPTAYAAGDTVTIDGTAYTLRTVDGSALTAGAWAAGVVITGVADVDNRVLVVAPSAPAGARPATWTPTAAQVGAVPVSASCNKNWAWSGQSGQPSWLWGSNDGQNMYVYNPSNFNVNYANGAGNVGGYSFEDSSADPSGSLPVGRVHFTWG